MVLQTDTPRSTPANVQDLGPVFAKLGYVFRYLFRRGEGLSALLGYSPGDQP
jgi:hypothetical protein